MSGIKICITVDWEGEDLSYIPALNRVREKTENQIPFTHFICPNYFSGTNNNNQISEQIESGLLQIDEVGLHVHCYRELIEKEVGIGFKSEQNYHNPPNWFQKKIIKRINSNYTPPLSGRGVPLSVYSEKEIEQIIATCKSLLIENLNVNELLGFRAGGWIANDTVFQVVQQLNFRYDSSAVAPSVLSQGFSAQSEGNRRDDLGDKNGLFTEHILKLWGYQLQKESFLRNKKILDSNNGNAIMPSTQPYTIGGLIEVPNNCGLSDFSSGTTTVLPLVNQYLQALKEDPEKEFVIVYGCHLEGDNYYKGLLLDAIYDIQALNSNEIQFCTIRDILQGEK